MKSMYGSEFGSFGVTDYEMNKQAADFNKLKGRGGPKGQAPAPTRTEFRDFFCGARDDRVMKPCAVKVDPRAGDSLSHTLGAPSAGMTTTAREMFRWPGSQSVPSLLPTRGNLELTEGRATDFWTSEARNEYRWHGKPPRRRRPAMPPPTR
eukprot:gb/GFBE01079051.1/.p1 GENE.gb/GFBE01079051.1/~~gb/GFBE01079051.1/.p1  ORF type:complete len:151 (+),score=7.59 gb/GFBE01079051.1/:1-453(+)